MSNGRLSPNKIKCPFTLYSIDTMHLVDHITERNPYGDDPDRVRFLKADFDVMEDGTIMIFVDGKEPLKL